MLGTIFVWKYIVLAVVKNKENAYRFMRSFWLGLGLLAFTYRADLFLYLAVILAWFYMTKLLHKTKIIVPLSWSIVIIVLYLN